MGYVCFFPLKKHFYNKVIVGNEMYDDNIKADDISAYVYDENLNIFMISIAVRPEYQKKQIGKSLVEQMFTFLDVKRKEGYKIENIINLFTARFISTLTLSTTLHNLSKTFLKRT